MSKVQPHVRLAQQIADAIELKRQNYASLSRKDRKKNPPRDRYWNDNRADELLDVQPRTQIVVHVLLQHAKTFGLETTSDIGAAFFKLLVEDRKLPVRGRGGRDRHRKDVVF